MTHPKVSVIIPTRNYGRFVSEAISSVRRQTLPDWEAIVVDDHSTDDTRERVEEIAAVDRRIVYVPNRRRVGPSGARNTGLEIAAGKYVQFLDADDVLEDDKLRVHAEFLDRFADVGIVYGDARPLTSLPGAWEVSSAALGAPTGVGRRVVASLVERNRLVVTAPLLRRSVLDRVGAFDESLRALEDWDLWLRCALSDVRFARCFEPATATLIRMHSESASRNMGMMLVGAVQLRAKVDRLLQCNDLRRRNRVLLARVRAKLAWSMLRRDPRRSLAETTRALGDLIWWAAYR